MEAMRLLTAGVATLKGILAKRGKELWGPRIYFYDATTAGSVYCPT